MTDDEIKAALELAAQQIDPLDAGELAADLGDAVRALAAEVERLLDLQRVGDYACPHELERDAAIAERGGKP